MNLCHPDFLGREQPPAWPVLILAPMQDITDLAFWRVQAKYGPPDLYYTEYFRVHRDSRPERHIQASIEENDLGVPIQAQMIGQDIPALLRTARLLQKLPVHGIDLNLGCPAPIVCKKEAGGGLLRNPEKVEQIITALRGEVEKKFTVKTRLGFDRPEEFPALIQLFGRHALDALTVHGRTVREGYGPVVHFDAILQAVAALPFPVFANGNVNTPEVAQHLVSNGASGLMIGRGAIRNPWIFSQIRAAFQGEPPFQPTAINVRHYIDELHAGLHIEDRTDLVQLSLLKKFLRYIAPGFGGDDAFWVEARTALSLTHFFRVCDQHLLEDHAEMALPSTCCGK
jgi:tRNA-dihydrouridine synthase